MSEQDDLFADEHDAPPPACDEGAEQELPTAPAAEAAQELRYRVRLDATNTIALRDGVLWFGA